MVVFNWQHTEGKKGDMDGELVGKIDGELLGTFKGKKVGETEGE